MIWAISSPLAVDWGGLAPHRHCGCDARPTPCPSSWWHWVLQDQDASLALGLVAHVGVLLAHAHQHALVSQVAHDRGKDCLGSIIPEKAALCMVELLLTSCPVSPSRVAGVDWRWKSSEGPVLKGWL